MPYRNVGRWFFFSVILAFIATVVSVAVWAIVYFVILPNTPNDKSSSNVVSYSLGVVALVGLIAALFFVEVVLCSVVRKTYFPRPPPNSSSAPIIRDRDKVNYRATEYNVSRGDRTNRQGRIFGPNLDSVGDETPAEGSTLTYLEDSRRPSSFAEELYRNFKAIQLSHAERETKPGPKEFLESVDEEGYHFDNLGFGQNPNEDDCAPTHENEEIDIDVVSRRQRLTRLDTFDKRIIGVLEEPSTDDDDKAEDEEGPIIGGKENDSPTKKKITRQDSFKDVFQPKSSFDKYLSFVALDEEIEADVFGDEQELPSRNKALEEEQLRKDVLFHPEAGKQ